MRETPETMAELQAIIDRSARTAGPAIARNFIGGGWRMSAEEFVAFWGDERMASISTVSSKGNVHVAPLDLKLIDGKFYAPTFPDSQRLRDHRANPRCAVTSWDGPYRAVIVYGIARVASEDPAMRTGATAAEQGYDVASLLTVEITPTRMYAIRPPEGHHAYTPTG